MLVAFQLEAYNEGSSLQSDRTIWVGGLHLAFQATVLRVLIASPGDVPEERELIPQVIRRWNSRHAESEGVVLFPVSWEIDGTPGYEEGKDGQELLNKDIVDSCDMVIAVFYSRLGTPTLRADSGTVEEIKRFVSQQKPVAVYFSDRPMAPSMINPEQLSRLRVFKDEFRSQGLAYDFRDINEFREMLHDHIHTLTKKALTRTDMELGVQRKDNSLEDRTTPSVNNHPQRSIRVDVSIGLATGWQNPEFSVMRMMGLPVPEQKQKNPILLIVKAVNEGPRPVTINSWGIDVPNGTIIPPAGKIRCTDMSLPARLEDGEALTCWIEYDAVKEHGFEFPRDKGSVWVDDATGKRWFCMEQSE